MARATFKNFVDKISKSPPEAIIGALDRECDLLRLDLAGSSRGLPDQAYSILYFKIFVRAARIGDVVDLVIHLPEDEVNFFEKTTSRLVQANALPVSALDHFRSTFQVTEKARNIHMRKELMKNQEWNRLGREA